MTPYDRDQTYTDILTMPERLAHALDRIDLDRMPDKDLKSLQRRLVLLVSAAQELVGEYGPRQEPELEVAD